MTSGRRNGFPPTRPRARAFLAATGLATAVVLAGLTTSATAAAVRTCTTQTAGIVNQVRGERAFEQINKVGGNTYSGSVSWGDGTSSPITSGRVFHIYKSPGSYLMTLSGTGVIAAAGASTPCRDDHVQIARVIVHNVTPVVRVTEKHVAHDGKPAVAVTFDASRSVGGRLITGYSWTFDPAGAASGPRVTRVIARPSHGPAVPVRATVTVKTPYGSVRRQARGLVSPAGTSSSGSRAPWVIAGVILVLAVAAGVMLMLRKRHARTSDLPDVGEQTQASASQ